MVAEGSQFGENELQIFGHFVWLLRLEGILREGEGGGGGGGEGGREGGSCVAQYSCTNSLTYPISHLLPLPPSLPPSPTHQQLHHEGVPPSGVVVGEDVSSNFSHVSMVLGPQHRHTFVIATCRGKQLQSHISANTPCTL